MRLLDDTISPIVSEIDNKHGSQFHWNHYHFDIPSNNNYFASFLYFQHVTISSKSYSKSVHFLSVLACCMVVSHVPCRPATLFGAIFTFVFEHVFSIKCSQRICVCRLPVSCPYALSHFLSPPLAVTATITLPLLREELTWQIYI